MGICFFGRLHSVGGTGIVAMLFCHRIRPQMGFLADTRSAMASYLFCLYLFKCVP